MAESVAPHLLVIPFPAQGHLLPLLDLCHILSTRSKLNITIVITTNNLPSLSPLLSSSPSISPLILQLPSSPDSENTYKFSPNQARLLIHTFSSLLHPILQWSQSHPNPPIAIISDFFTSGWTLRLARSLSIPRISFSPSGAFALATIRHLWRQIPSNSDPNLIIPFPSLPNSPSFPLSQLSGLFRSYRAGDYVSDSIKQNFQSEMQSWGFIINTFSDFESGYIDQLLNDRIWAVGPLVGSGPDRKTDAVAKEKIITWLGSFPAGFVLYICFGSQAAISPPQAAALSAALELSSVRFLWCVREGTEIPAGFGERVSGRGLVVKGWAPQVEILGHAAVGWFLSHCGWNSVIEAVMGGVALLAWPRGADQFVNARLVEDAGMAIRVAEGSATVPDVDEMVRVLDSAAKGESDGVKARAAEMREIARKAVAEGGSSYRDLESLVAELNKLSAGAGAVVKKF